jgi:hypothetical protein
MVRMLSNVDTGTVAGGGSPMLPRAVATPGPLATFPSALDFDRGWRRSFPLRTVGIEGWRLLELPQCCKGDMTADRVPGLDERERRLLGLTNS